MFDICGIMLYNVNEQRSSLRTREVDSFLFCNILKDKEGYRPMDEIDLKLLRLLQKNSRTPIKTLAGEVRLSSPAVSARIERLEKQGYIIMQGRDKNGNPVYARSTKKNYNNPVKMTV